MRIDEKDVCSFQNWYHLLKNHSFKSVVLQIPEDVLQYLRSDLVTIPTEATVPKAKSENIDDITYSDWDSEGEDQDEIEPPSFPLFSAQLQKIIDSFGGCVFIKMNWSAPTDAAWVATTNSLKCCNLQDAYLLLKCSDKISLDLSYSYNHYIVLKKWEDIHPGSEFRCFVSDKKLLAITQRSKSEFHRHILFNKSNIISEIKTFFENILRDKFLLSNYIFDVVWNQGSHIKLVDINVFSIEKTECYLFNADEVFNMEYNEELSPEFRFIGEEIGIQPSNLSRHFGLPIDLTLSGTSSNLIDLLQTQLDMKS